MKARLSFFLIITLIISLLNVATLFAQADDPVIAVDFSGDASDTTQNPQSNPVLVGSAVTIGQGYAEFDGSANAFIDYGNGAENELRLFGHSEGESLDTMTIWARISSKQIVDSTGDLRVIVSRWGPQQRSFQLAVYGDGRVYACFTSNGDWSGYVEAVTVESNLVRNDASQIVDLAVRFDQGDVAIFVDGVEKQLSIDTVGSYQTIYNSDTTAKTVIGGIVLPGQTSASRSFIGIINNVKIYGEALLDEEIASLGSSDRQDVYENNCQILGTLPTNLNPDMSHYVIEGNKEYEYMAICPVLCELADGTIIAAYHRSWSVDFYGQYNTYIRFSYDGGKTWSVPSLVATNAQSPGLLRLPSGDLLLNACRSMDSEGNSTMMRLFRSSDNGQTWMEQTPIWQSSTNYVGQGGAGGLVRLNTGRILCPVFGAVGNAYSGEGTFKAYVYYSDDNGNTWQEGAGKVTLVKRGAMEPSIVELLDGTLLMSIRTQMGEIYLSKSTDGGVNWSRAWPTGLQMAESNQTIVRINGTNDLMIVWTSAPFDPNHHHSGERTPLSYAMSVDDGITWHKIGDIAGGSHELGTSSGNAVLFTSTDDVIIADTLNFIAWDRSIYTGSSHVSITEKEYLYDRYENVVDPLHSLNDIELSWYKIIQDDDWYNTELQNPGDTAQITVMGILNDGGMKKLTGEVVYSSDRTGVATVDSNGVVTVVGNGTATITAQVTQGSDTFTDTMQVVTANAWTAVNPNGPETEYEGSNWYIMEDWNCCSRGAGDYAEFSFLGTGVRLYVEAGPNAGYSDIYIDGGFVTMIDSYQPVWQTNKLIFEITGLSYGQHVLKAVCKQERNPAAGNNGLFINKFEFIQ